MEPMTPHTHDVQYHVDAAYSRHVRTCIRLRTLPMLKARFSELYTASDNRFIVLTTENDFHIRVNLDTGITNAAF